MPIGLQAHRNRRNLPRVTNWATWVKLAVRPRDAQNVLAEGTMHRPQRAAEIGPRRFTRLIVFVLAVLGSAVGVANLPSGANAQPQTQVDSGYLGFEAITKPTCPQRPRPPFAQHTIPEPDAGAGLQRSADAAPDSHTVPTPKPTKLPTPSPVPTPYIPPGIDVSRYQGSLAYPKVARRASASSM